MKKKQLCEERIRYRRIDSRSQTRDARRKVRGQRYSSPEFIRLMKYIPLSPAFSGTRLKLCLPKYHRWVFPFPQVVVAVLALASSLRWSQHQSIKTTSTNKVAIGPRSYNYKNKNLSCIDLEASRPRNTSNALQVLNAAQQMWRVF